MKHKTRKRFEQLQNKYRTEKDSRIKAEKERKDYEADATYYRQFRNYLVDNQISTEEANILFDIGAKMKSDPAAALQALTPYYNMLLENTGHVLSQDLQEQVNKGYITERHAYELSRERASNNNLRKREAINQERQQHQQNTQHQQQQFSNIQSAITNLEKNWEQSDPDYKIKNTRIQERIRLKLFEARANGSLPKSPDEAVKLAEISKKEIDKEMSAFLVKRKPITPVDGGGSGSGSKPKPQSTLDVIRQTVGG
jgi:hypothetical protein